MMDKTIHRILTLTPEQWSRFLLYTSPAARSISSEQVYNLTDLALRTGRRASRDIPVGASVYSFAKKLGIAIEYDQAPQSAICFAKCQTSTSKSRIIVFTQNILRMSETAAEVLGTGCVPLHLILWHELFHGMEQQALYTELLDVKVELSRIGLFTLRTRLRSLSEIGAMAFACSACGWSFNPLILNYLLLRSCDRQAAERFAQDLLTIGHEHYH